MRLLDDFIISATVDGVIRTFSIAKREMLGQFKLSDLAARQPEYAAKLKDVGGTALSLLAWFEAEGRFMAVSGIEGISLMTVRNQGHCDSASMGLG